MRALGAFTLTTLAGLMGQVTYATTLERVQVNATSLAVNTVPSVSSAIEQIASTAGAASVISAQSYQEGRVSTPTDALKYAPGVFVASRFGAEESRISIRGSGLQRTFHGRGVLVMQDGVPLNLADGMYDFQAIEPLSAQYAEVYRGANAAQFGSSTLGGAINFVAPTGATAKSQIRLEAGDFDYQRLYAQLAQKNESGDVFLSASQFAQTGFREQAEQNTQRVFANIGFATSPAVSHRLYFSYVNSESQLPGTISLDEFKRGEIEKADPIRLPQNHRRDYELLRAAYKNHWHVSDLSHLEMTAFVSQKSLFHPIFQVLNQDTLDTGIGARWVRFAPFARDNDKWIVGTQFTHGTTDEKRYVNVLGRTGAPTAASDNTAHTLSVYSDYQLALTPSLNTYMGLQWLSTYRDFDDKQINSAPIDRGFDERYEAFLPKLGFIKTLNNEAQLFANISATYEAPTFGELSGGPGVSQLKAQKGTSIEIGARHFVPNMPQAWWELTAYRAHLKNEMLGLEGAAGATTTMNADKTIHQGVEAGLSVAVSDLMLWRLSYQLNDFSFDNDSRFGNNTISGVPDQVLQTELIWRKQGFYMGPVFTAASHAYLDHANKVSVPGYAVYGFKLGQKLDNGFSWFMDLRNLSNKVYAATNSSVRDATELSNGQPQRLINPGEGRAVYAGLSYTF